MKKISIIVAIALGLLLPLASLADDASSTASSTAPSGLQVPADWQPTTDNGVIPDGLFVGDAPTAVTGMYQSGPRLIKLDGSDTVYWVSENNLKIPMLTRAVFLSYNNKDEDVQTVSQDEFDYYQDAKYIWLNGTGGIYKVDTGAKTKRLITSDVWNGSGLDAGQIINVNRTDFNSYKTGSKVTVPADM
jgi:hypothetical protein